MYSFQSPVPAVGVSQRLEPPVPMLLVAQQMLSDDERVFFEVDDRQDNRRRRNGLELFRAVDQETFRFTEIDFGEVKFYFGAVVGTLRQMRREKSRYLLGGGNGRRADDFGFFRVIARNEVSAQQEQDCFQNQNVGFHVVMVLGLK